MDEHDKKDLEEAVEEAIKKHEEKRKGIHSMEKAPKIEKKNKMKHIDMIILLGIVAVLLVWGFWPVLMPGEVEQGVVIVYPANVVLDSFDDKVFGAALSVIPIDNPWGLHVTVRYVDVSFELNNTGDEIAKDVSCFIKCCDQNGTILFAQLFMFNDIEPYAVGKIPASRTYHVPVSDEVIYVTHSINVQWSPQGGNMYTKLTEL